MLNVPVRERPKAVAIADVDSDGILDVIATGYDGSVEVLIGSGDSTLAAPVGFAAGARLQGSGSSGLGSS